MKTLLTQVSPLVSLPSCTASAKSLNYHVPQFPHVGRKRDQYRKPLASGTLLINAQLTVALSYSHENDVYIYACNCTHHTHSGRCNSFCSSEGQVDDSIPRYHQLSVIWQKWERGLFLKTKGLLCSLLRAFSKRG